MAAGILYGIGVGPGDPELITLKALRRIRESDVILLPAEPKEECYAYLSVREIMPEIEEKEIVCLPFPMRKEREALQEAHDRIYGTIQGLLVQGKKVGFITIGDATIYSTYSYVEKRARKEGFACESVSGVPSFCAAAAALGISLGENKEEIHIIPASYDIEASLGFLGTKIYMKSGRKLGELKKALERLPQESIKVYAVSNCGLAGERHYYGVQELDENSGYLTIVIVKSNTPLETY